MFATRPENVFLADSFDDLDKVKSAMTSASCKENLGQVTFQISRESRSDAYVENSLV